MKKILAIVFTAMLFEHLACAALLVPRQAGKALVVVSNSRLQWSWPYSAKNIVFNVYSETDFAVPHSAWKIIGTTTSTNFPVAFSLPAQYFFVLASNTATGAVSPWP